MYGAPTRPFPHNPEVEVCLSCPCLREISEVRSFLGVTTAACSGEGGGGGVALSFHLASYPLSLSVKYWNSSAWRTRRPPFSLLSGWSIALLNLEAPRHWSPIQHSKSHAGPPDRSASSAHVKPPPPIYPTGSGDAEADDPTWSPTGQTCPPSEGKGSCRIETLRSLRSHPR